MPFKTLFLLSTSVADRECLAASPTALSDFILCRQSSSHLFSSYPRPSWEEKSNILQKRLQSRIILLIYPLSEHHIADPQMLLLHSVKYITDIIMFYQCTQSGLKNKTYSILPTRGQTVALWSTVWRDGGFLSLQPWVENRQTHTQSLLLQVKVTESQIQALLQMLTCFSLNAN